MRERGGGHVRQRRRPRRRLVQKPKEREVERKRKSVTVVTQRADEGSLKKMQYCQRVEGCDPASHVSSSFFAVSVVAERI